MLPALAVSVYYGEGQAALGFVISMLLIFFVGALCSTLRPRITGFYAAEGFAAAGLTWIMVSLAGALPFFFSGAIPNFINCVFETVSGFSTTGASIVSNIEALPRGILYWRSFTHWLGGMGVLVFILAFASLTSKNSGESIFLLRAESPGVKISKLVPRMKSSASILYKIYIVLSLIQFVLLALGSVPVFDAVNIVFSTAGTGGFGIKNDSIMSYGAYTQWVVTVFMLLFSINFNMFYLLLIRSFRRVFKNEELRIYLAITAIAILFIAINTASIFEGAATAARTVSFEVVSVITTTGFFVSDYDGWPQFSRVIIFLLMFIGGCAGSTSGGAKVVRIAMMFKSARRTIYRAINPNAVKLVHMEGEVVTDDTVESVNGYMMLYFLIIAVATALISLNGLELETTFTAVIACINNIGPGLGGVGPLMNYEHFSYFSKIVLSIVMLIGRLEIFPIMALFTAEMWVRRRKVKSRKAD